MKLDQLKTRVASFKEKIEKKEALIEKKERLIEKANAEIDSFGRDRVEAYKGKFDHEIPEDVLEIKYNCVYKIENLEEDIERIKKEIKELKNKLSEYESQLYLEKNKKSEDDKLIESLPPEINLMKEELIQIWDEEDKQWREKILKAEKEKDYKNFEWEDYYKALEMTDEKIHANNEELARQLVIDLVKRVYKVTGDIIEWKDLHLARGSSGTGYIPVIAGIVIGKEGKARVQTVPAGGYNIQKLHARVIVTKLKD